MTEMIDDDFEDTILHKIDNGIKLTEEEFKELVYAGLEETGELHVNCFEDTSDGVEAQLSVYELIVKLKGRFFCLEYEYDYSFRSKPIFNFTSPLYEVHPVRVTETRYVPKFSQL